MTQNLEKNHPGDSRLQICPITTDGYLGVLNIGDSPGFGGLIQGQIYNP